MSEFVNNLQEVFAQFGSVSAKRMFGGYGIFHDGLMFGLVAEDVLYLKTDKHSVADFIELNLPPFEYEKKGKSVQMSYYLAPEQIYDDADEAQVWAKKAFDAALRCRN
ncbi:MAG: TfoX/Sxy family protein [Pseudomonadota bacterium]|nr:TfoX/Sxy family protein [Pseudomonadota bacterium]